MLLSFVKAIAALPERKELLRKMIRECYCMVVEEPRNTILSAERTLAIALFSYFDHDLQNMSGYSIQDYEELFQAKKTIKSEEYLTKLQNIILAFQREIIN